ncbi:MAG TPA: type II toxin-antitoxin system RelE/ParE family toxin [Geminicoccaceae bacterium]|nr:type II toxin-antitoxin system RelE/ParE family toxin [Geminicoccaceae bacterium]
MRLRYRRSAIEDLGEIRKYIARDDPAAARRFVAGIRTRCRLLAEQPYIGRERSEIRPGLRSLSFQSYVVFYRIIDDSVEIVSVVHGSRDIEAMFRVEP